MSELSALIMRDNMLFSGEMYTSGITVTAGGIIGSDKSHSEFLKSPWHDIFQNMYVVKTYIERWSYCCGDAMAMVIFHGFPQSSDAMFEIIFF